VSRKGAHFPNNTLGFLDVFGGMGAKLQTPSSKLQKNPKLQTFLELGTWSLELLASAVMVYA
jgi:hypothetical protein